MNQIKKVFPRIYQTLCELEELKEEKKRKSKDEVTSHSQLKD
ncbi:MULTISPECIES: hypothetical protein [unclassified Streptococcus]|nr:MULTISPECIES: hypothetical protein [unclassified Streptococcus]